MEPVVRPGEAGRGVEMQRVSTTRFDGLLSGRRVEQICRRSVSWLDSGREGAHWRSISPLEIEMTKRLPQLSITTASGNGFRLQRRVQLHQNVLLLQQLDKLYVTVADTFSNAQSCAFSKCFILKKICNI